MQDDSDSSALAIELLQSYSEPSIYEMMARLIIIIQMILLKKQVQQISIQMPVIYLCLNVLLYMSVEV